MSELLHTNQTSMYIAPPTNNGRQLVVPDVHACPNTLRALVAQINLQPQDQLFFLGDYINKGSDSAGVLNYLLELKQHNFQLFLLRGNHEHMLLEKDYRRKNKGETYDNLPSYFRVNALLDTNKHLRKPYFDLLYNMPYYYETEKFYFVHAGFNISYLNPYLNAATHQFWEDWESMLWIRDFSISKDEQAEFFKGKHIIFGHTPTYLDFIQKDVLLKSPAIGLDNGCVFKSQMFLGNLLCLDTTNWELFIQPNID
jgi:serine/threonine protein phosphatase 1